MFGFGEYNNPRQRYRLTKSAFIFNDKLSSEALLNELALALFEQNKTLTKAMSSRVFFMVVFLRGYWQQFTLIFLLSKHTS